MEKPGPRHSESVRVGFDVLLKEKLSALTRVRNLFMIKPSNRDELELKISQYNFFCHKLHKNNSQGPKLFLRLRSEKAAPTGQQAR